MNWKLIIFSLLLAAPVFADDFKAANALYDAGKFAEAAAAYEKIEPKTAHVYYNLGNAQFRQHKLGLAILNYERARRLSPRDPDILANLKFAEQRAGAEDVNMPPRAVQRLMHSVVESQTLREWSAYELAGVWLTALLVGACIYFPRMRAGFLIVAVACFLAFGVSTSALCYRWLGDRTAPEGIVITTDAEARFAPLPESTVHFKLAEGTKVAIREDRSQWLFVERADGQQGWVQTDAIERIVPR